jgi:hypothetical protein
MFKEDLLKGKRILVTGGGTLFRISTVSLEDWEQLRAMIRSSNANDKANRG